MTEDCPSCGLPMEPTLEDIDMMTEAAQIASAQFRLAKEQGRKEELSAIGFMIYHAALVLTQQRAKWEKSGDETIADTVTILGKH